MRDFRVSCCRHLNTNEFYFKFKHWNLGIATEDWSTNNKKNSLHEQSENLKRVKSEETVKAVIVKEHVVLPQQGNQ